MKRKKICTLICLSLIIGMIFTMIGCEKKENTKIEKPIDKLIEEDGFVYGILIPWFKTDTYGIDIGGNHRSNYQSCGFDEAVVKNDLANCKAMGFNMVKLWLSEIMEGIVFDDQGNVTGVDETYLTNLKKIFDIAKELDVNLALTMVSHLSFSAISEEEYNFLTRFIFEPEITKQYLANFVTPVLNLAKEYDNILMIDLYAEPEGDLYDEGAQNTKTGTTWAKMGTFLKTLGKEVKKINPNWAVTASSGWAEYNNLDKYDKWNLDYISVDIYNNTGELKKVADMNLSSPVMLGEFGPMVKNNWTDIYQTNLTRAFYQNAVKKGYAGAFFWMYGYKGSGEALTLIDNDGNLRPTAANLRYDSLDREYEKSGYAGLDKPAIIYTNNDEKVKWIGARDAESYVLERSTDKNNWTVAAEILAGDAEYMYAEQMYAFEDLSAGEEENYYRVIAIKGEETAISDVSFGVIK